ncbi:hypothetical protein [Glaciecola petra]|uniref:Uncharacterized protein n=1 Tax=Glaciecola petra TaxID=3075602 RepID=A0ABU2ZQS2_9ALTE|nr:hypothetical protein [Aestuariibacter sp. P117]MDT0594989.1 hypothetical protein [Aestuariibacter sp. P117]
MYIPAHISTANTQKTKPAKRAAVTLDKAKANQDTTKQEVIHVVDAPEKRDGEDRRQRNEKILLDTRSGRDRRHSKNRMSIDTKA